jgi:DNA helicase-2/ATP-dependent DNA helicase PcrA
MKTSEPHRRRHLSASPFNNRVAPEVEHFAVHDRVTHDKYGIGRVVSRTEHSVVVAFGTEHIRVASPFSKITKV